MAEASASGKSDAQPRQRLNPRWREHFIEHLAQTSNVTLSAEVAGVSTNAAYRAKANEPPFAQRWLEALWEGYAHLEMEILRRLREGDLQTDDASKYDFANAIRLLSMHRENAAKAQSEKLEVSAAEIRASIDKKIEEIRKRVQQEKAREASAL
ncbi:MAG: hypothetical protein AAFO17_15380 [Pseudomonadota bacterium]